MFGYSLKDTDTSRRRIALKHAVEYWGSTYVIKKLNVLAIYRKRRQITMGKRARADMKYVQKHLRDVPIKTKHVAKRRTKLSPSTPNKLHR